VGEVGGFGFGFGVQQLLCLPSVFVELEQHVHRIMASTWLPLNGKMFNLQRAAQKMTSGWSTYIF